MLADRGEHLVDDHPKVHVVHEIANMLLDDFGDALGGEVARGATPVFGAPAAPSRGD